MNLEAPKSKSFDIVRIKDQMTKFNERINKANIEIANKLVAEDAPFYTPVYGGKGYFSLVF